MFPCHCPWMPSWDALKGAQRTGYHIQKRPIGPCSSRPTGQGVCVCHDGGEVGLRGINYLCASPAVGGTKVAPAEGLIIRKRAF